MSVIENVILQRLKPDLWSIKVTDEDGGGSFTSVQTSVAISHQHQQQPSLISAPSRLYVTAGMCVSP